MEGTETLLRMSDEISASYKQYEENGRNSRREFDPNYLSSAEQSKQSPDE